MEEEFFDQEVLLLLQEELVKTFPEIGDDIIWEILTSYECSEIGLQKAVEKIMEMSGNESLEVEEEVRDNNNNNNENETTIEKFDRENNFKPNSDGFGIMNMASDIWNSITNRKKKPMKGNGYFKVEDDDELKLEMQHLGENKKDL